MDLQYILKIFKAYCKNLQNMYHSDQFPTNMFGPPEISDDFCWEFHDSARLGTAWADRPSEQLPPSHLHGVTENHPLFTILRDITGSKTRFL